MKSQISKTGILIAASLLTLMPLTSAKAETMGRFHIPFQFVAAGATLPAGYYVVQVNSASRSVELSSSNGAARLFLSGNAPYRSGKMDNGCPVFKKSGKTYFLDQTWKAGAKWGYELPASRAEREMASAQAPDAIVTISPAGGSN